MMNVLTLDKLLPGILPPKEEPDTPVDFVAILDSFDPASVPDPALSRIAADQTRITGSAKPGASYTLEGQTFPVPPQPVDTRIHSGKDYLSTLRENLGPEGRRYKTYTDRRSKLALAIKVKTAVYVAEREAESLSAEQKEKQRALWDQYDRGYVMHDPMYTPSAIEAGGEYEKQKQQEEDLKQAQFEADQIHDYMLTHGEAREAVYKLVQRNVKELWEKISELVPEKKASSQTENG